MKRPSCEVAASPIVLGLAIMLWSCGVEDREPRSVQVAQQLPAAVVEKDDLGPAVNLILVSVDTLRADHLGCYGYERDTSPAIDRFAAEAVLFEQTIAQAPSTLPSHASIFTSLLPDHHGAFVTREAAVPGSVLTLAEVLSGAGWRCGAVTGGGQMAPEHGLGQGFEHYELTIPSAPFSETVRRGLRWIRQVQGEPFFLFLHTYETHHPYTPRSELLETFAGGYDGPLPPRISKQLLEEINAGERVIDGRDLAFIVSAYDAEIRSVDDGFAELLEAIEEAGVSDRSLIVFTSDHGEEFGEHGSVGWHSHTLFDELLHVPLLVRLPGGRGRGSRVEALVRSLDIAPTMLEAAGVRPPEDFTGRSLLPLIDEPSQPWRAVAVSRRDAIAAFDHVCLRTERWKLYPNSLFNHKRALEAGSPFTRYAARFETKLHPWRLYDLEADSIEQDNLRGCRRAVVRDLAGRLELELESRPTPIPVQANLSNRTVEELRALGYVE